MSAAADDYQVQRSRAIVPDFYRAPSPETLPNGMRVMDFQLAGAEYVLNRNHALLGDAPGLTKSAQSILVSNAIEAKRTLVVCPASLRLNWEREIWAWSTIPNVSTYPILKGRDGVSEKADYVIISYSLLSNPSILNALMAVKWDHLILDEAHALKDPKGNNRTKIVCAPDLLPSVVGRITMASGTILPNQPIEAYNAIRLLNWNAIDRMSLADFRNYYYTEGGGFVRGPVFNPATQSTVYKLHWSEHVKNVPRNLDDLQFRLRKYLMVRRLKDQVLSQLPTKQWHLFPLQMDTAIRKALKHPGWAAAEKLYELDTETFNAGILIDGEIGTARRLLGEAKAPSVVAYVEELLREGTQKIVLSAWHHTVLDYLREHLAKYGLVYMDGSTSAAKKQTAVDQFQTDEDVRIILGQMQPLGMGWTLTAAQDVVFAEPDWVPGVNEQMIDRIHRVGQRGQYVIGHVPVVPDTLDERILGTAIDKDQNIYKALDATL